MSIRPPSPPWNPLEHDYSFPPLPEADNPVSHQEQDPSLLPLAWDEISFSSPLPEADNPISHQEQDPSLLPLAWDETSFSLPLPEADNPISHQEQDPSLLPTVSSDGLPFPAPFPSSIESSLQSNRKISIVTELKIQNRLRTKPITEAFLKTTLIPADMKTLSTNEIARVNQQFKDRIIVPEIDVQRFCFGQFQKVIPTEPLCNHNLFPCSQLAFNTLRTGLPSRRVDDQAIDKLIQAKQGTLSRSQLSEPLQHHLDLIHKQDRSRRAGISLSFLSKPYPPTHENASSLDKVYNHLRTKPITEAFFKTTLIPADMKTLSTDEIARINQQFKDRIIVPEIDVQRFCFGQFQKVIPTEPLCNHNLFPCSQLAFNTLRTGLPSRRVDDQAIDKLIQAKQGTLSRSQLSEPLQHHLDLIHKQDSSWPQAQTERSLSFLSKSYPPTHENASSLDKVYNHLRTKPITEAFFKTTLIPASMKTLSTDEISKVNERFRSAYIVREIDVQRFCFGKFQKVIPTNPLCSPKLSPCKQLAFNVLRTGQPSRRVDDQAIDKLIQARLDNRSQLNLPKHLRGHIKLIHQQNKAQRKSNS